MQQKLLRHDWTIDEIQAIYKQPIIELIYQAQTIHRQYHQPNHVQVCHLISVKTGGCPENCKYCAQSSRYQTAVKAEALLSVGEVVARAKVAAAKGATRICLGAAWREVRQNKPFEEILKMVEGIAALGVEVCCCLGMLDAQSAKKLVAAGIYAYNHNLDTSANYYSQIITTRTYEDRLKTLDVLEKAGISVCCGGIIGMGESEVDRLELLQTLANRPKHPESVPINLLTPIAGTPLGNQPPVPIWECVRMFATARILMPCAMVRFSAGRLQLSKSEQALCFMAGANSIFSGEVLLTVANPDFNADEELFDVLGLKKHTRHSCCRQ